jgi:hypothetical protein
LFEQSLILDNMSEIKCFFYFGQKIESVTSVSTNQTPNEECQGYHWWIAKHLAAPLLIIRIKCSKCFLFVYGGEKKKIYLVRLLQNDRIDMKYEWLINSQANVWFVHTFQIHVYIRHWVLCSVDLIYGGKIDGNIGDYTCCNGRARDCEIKDRTEGHLFQTRTSVYVCVCVPKNSTLLLEIKIIIPLSGINWKLIKY